MAARGRTGIWILGIAGVLAVVSAGAYFGFGGKARRGSDSSSVVFDEKTPLPMLTKPLRDSDGRALAALFQRTLTRPDAAASPMADAEAAQWADALKSLRSGYLKYGSTGRSSALVVVGRTFQRLAAQPGPKNWAEFLPTAHDLLAAGIADADVSVRAAALVEVGKIWGWLPARPLTPVEENSIAEWKDGFNDPVVRRLGDRDPRVRVAAVACLGTNPLTPVASQAIPYLDDPESPEVRQQVLASFAARPAILSDELVLKRLNDKVFAIGMVAEMVLKTRGLSQEQISLGSMIYHAKPEMRASVIPLIKNRTDIDPVVWLLQLSRDSEESVRLGAIDALAKQSSPEVGRRLAEMAASDQSAEVRKAASKFLLPGAEKTAALPPLPGSPSLNPRAN
jgi:HEAT repeat protein